MWKNAGNLRDGMYPVTLAACSLFIFMLQVFIIDLIWFVETFGIIEQMAVASISMIY